jgi:hypothetical protein
VDTVIFLLLLSLGFLGIIIYLVILVFSCICKGMYTFLIVGLNGIGLVFFFLALNPLANKFVGGFVYHPSRTPPSYDSAEH